MRGCEPYVLVIVALGCGSGLAESDAQPADSSIPDIDHDTIQDVHIDDSTEPDPACNVNSDCDDGDPCTDDICDHEEDTCIHQTVDEDGDGLPAEVVAGIVCDGNDCDDMDSSVGARECVGISECCDGCFKLNDCWRDPVTRYVWEDPRGSWYPSLAEARAYCDDLSLAGHGPGEWHVPTIDELRTLVRGCDITAIGGDCGVTDACSSESCFNDACYGCDCETGPGFRGCYWSEYLRGECGRYRSSTVDPDQPHLGWYLDFMCGPTPAIIDVSYGTYLRCVHTP